MNSVSVARLQLVAPQLADKIVQMDRILSSEGIQIVVAQGVRTWAEQDALWQKGRNPDGSFVDPVHHAGVVTNARGGHSWHNFGLAVDCDPDDPTKEGFQIDWNAEHPQWKRMEAVGVSLGLTSGANWKRLADAPHFQITGRFPEGAPTDEVRELFQASGYQAVWDQVFTV